MALFLAINECDVCFTGEDTHTTLRTRFDKIWSSYKAIIFARKTALYLQ